MRTWPILAILLFLSCGVDLTDPVSGPTDLIVDVIVSDPGGEGHVTVGGSLVLGPSIWDTPGAIADSALVVNDVEIRPTVNSDTGLSYEGGWSFTNRPTTDGTIAIRPPRLTGMAASYGVMTVDIPERSGAHDIVLPPDEDLVLTLAPQGDPAAPPPESQLWRLEIRGERSTISVHSREGLPNPIVVPADWLHAFPDSFTVEVVADRSFRVTHEGDRYRVAGTVRVTIGWRVSRPHPGGSG